MEREVGLSGIGGQGIQLAARTLALAAIADGLEVQVFGSYGGMMRGGNTDAAVVIADGRIMSPPTVSRFWGAIGMHPEYWDLLSSRVRAGGVALIDSSVFREAVTVDRATVVGVRATELASGFGAARAASMCALGAFAAATGIVTLGALLTAAESVLPSYRIEHRDANARVIAAGFALIEEPLVSAWSVGASS